VKGLRHIFRSIGATSTGRRLLARGTPPAAMYMMKVASCSPNLRRCRSGRWPGTARGWVFP